MHKFLKGKGLAILLTLAMMIVAVAVIVPIATAAEPAEIQNFQYQTLSSLDLKNDAETDLRFLFTIGKLDYTEVGFVVSKSNSTPTIGGANCYKAGTETVYSTITADDTPVPAPAGRFWVAVKLTDIPRSYFDGSLYVRAFVTDGEGTRYSAASGFTVCIADGHLVHTLGDFNHEITGGTASLMTAGTKIGICPGCNLEVTLDSGRTAVNHMKWIGGGAGDSCRDGIQMKDVLAGKHFHPDESNGGLGNDLYAEYSILWNETLLNLSPTVASGARAEALFASNSTGSSNTRAISYYSLTNNATNAGTKIAGAFEYPNGLINTSLEDDPYPKMCENNAVGGFGSSYADFPNVGGTDQDHPEWGWHRIGVRYHEDVTNLNDVRDNDAAPSYLLTVEVYVDGVLISRLGGDHLDYGGNDYKLYTVEKVEDDLVYHDINGELWFFNFALRDFAATEYDAFFVTGDYFITAGRGFVQNVTRIDNPAARIETVDGNDFNGAFYYTTVGSHDHVWGAEAVNDASASADCGHAATKSIHCTVCGATKPESTVNLPIDPSLHAYGAYVTVREPSILGDGLERRTCANCGGTDDRVLTATEPVVKTYTTLSDTRYGEKTQFSTILAGGKHFYPDASNDGLGNDLLIEYSLLWNDTLAKLYDTEGDQAILSARISGNASGSSNENDLTWMSLKNNARGSDCVFAGGYEYGGLRTVEYGPAKMSTYKSNGKCPGNTYADFPNIGGDDADHPEWGWHRVQIRYHEEVTNEAALRADESKGATPASYRLYVECYIDGVLLFRNSNAASATYSNSTMNTLNYLFTATSNGAGGIDYDDITTSRYIHGLRIPFTHTTAGTAYFVYGDYACSVGRDFKQTVTRIDNPAARVETVDATDLNGAFYYTNYGAHEHVWGSLVNDASHDADCGHAATQSIHCTLCGATKPESTVNLPIDPSLHAYGGFVTISEPTLLAEGVERRTCANCGGTDDQAIPYVHNVQKFTSSSSGSYSPNRDTLGNIRGSQHFYTAGNDLLVEYSVLWTEAITNLRSNYGPYMDTRFAQIENGDSTNKNIIYWSLSDNCSGSDCAYAGGFEWGGIDQNENDNPYPKFTASVWDAQQKKYVTGDQYEDFPNIGGANGGDGSDHGEQRWGWHRVSIRYRQEVTNVNAVKTGSDAEYKLSMWVYIDGVLVIHSYATDFIYKPKDHPENNRDYKLFTAACDGNGGITYTDINDDLYIHGAYLHYTKMNSGKTAYFEIADYSAKIGSTFEQNVVQVNNPSAATLEVESGVFVNATMWYRLAD